MIFIGTETLSPEIVTVFEIYDSPILASFTDGKENTSGVVSATKVVTEKDSENHHTVIVAVLVVLLLEEELTRS